jgi:hypothetical protein
MFLFSPDGKYLAINSPYKAFELLITPEFTNQQKLTFLLGEKEMSITKNELYFHNMPSLILSYL